MRPNILLIMLSMILISVSCVQNSPRQIDYKNVSASDGSYTVEIPSYLKTQNVGKMILFQSEPPHTTGFVKPTSTEEYARETEKSLEQKGFSYSELGRTDTTVVYRVSKGLFSAYKLYLIRNINQNMYLFTISSTDKSQNELEDIIAHISSSFIIKENEKTLQVQNQISSFNNSKINKIFKSYNKNFYSIKYPKDWKVIENINAMTEAYIGSETEDIGFTIVCFPTDESLSTIVQVGNEELRKTGATIISSKTIKIGNNSCIKSEAEFSVSGVKTKHISYTFKEDSVLFNIKFGNVNTQERYKVCEEIINTLIFK